LFILKDIAEYSSTMESLKLEQCSMDDFSGIPVNHGEYPRLRALVIKSIEDPGGPVPSFFAELTLLTKLNVKARLDNGSIRTISNLRRLESLKFCNHFEGWRSVSYHCLSELVLLTKLCIKHEPFELFRSQSIESWKDHIELSGFIGSLTKLQQISFDFVATCLCDDMHALQHLRRLEKIRFDTIVFPHHLFLSLARVNNLKHLDLFSLHREYPRFFLHQINMLSTLRVLETNLPVTDLLEEGKLPRLRDLHFVYQLDARELETLRGKFPRAKVHCTDLYS